MRRCVGRAPVARALDLDHSAPARLAGARLRQGARSGARRAGAGRRAARARRAAHRDGRARGRHQRQPRRRPAGARGGARARPGVGDGDRGAGRAPRRRPQLGGPGGRRRRAGRRHGRRAVPQHDAAQRRRHPGRAPQARAAARASYKLALTDDPSNIAAALSLETLCLLDEDWTELARTLCHEASLIGDPQTVRRLCERAGDLLWEKLHDAESALAAYHQAAKAAPTESSPLRRLSAVLESTGRWRELIDVYDKELGGHARPGGARRSVLPHRRDPAHQARAPRRRRGRLRGGARRRPAAPADAAVVRRALPLGRALGRAGADAAARGGEDHRSAAARRSPRRGRRAPRAPARRSPRGGAPASSAPTSSRPAIGSPSSRSIGSIAAHEKWAELVRLYEQQAPHTSDRALHRFLRQESARLWSERVPNSDKAAAAFADVWGIDERDLGPLFLMARVLEAAEKWEPLAGVLDQQTKVLRDDVDRIAVKQRLAAVLEVHLERPDDALAVHERVLELDSDNEIVAARDGAAAPPRRPLARGHRDLDAPARALRDRARARGAALSHRPRARAQARRARRRRRRLRARARRRSAARLGDARARSHPAPRSAVEGAVRGARAARQRARATRGSRRWCCTRSRRSRSCTCAISRRAQKRYRTVHERHPQYETASVALIHVAEARGDFAAAAAELARLVERTTHVEAKMALSGAARAHLRASARSARARRRLLHAGDRRLQDRTRLRARRAARHRSRAATSPTAWSAPLRRLGARCTDIRLAHGYRALAALRDEVVDRRRRPRAVPRRRAARAGRSAGGSSGIVRTLGSVARGRHRGRRPLAARARSPPPPTSARTRRSRRCACTRRRCASIAPRAPRRWRTYEQAARYTPDFLPLLRGRRRPGHRRGRLGRWRRRCSPARPSWPPIAPIASARS